MTYRESLHAEHKERVARLSQRALNARPPRQRPPTKVIEFVNGKRVLPPEPLPPSPRIILLPGKASSLPGLTAAKVIAAVSKHFGIGAKGLMGKSHCRRITIPKQIGFYIATTEIAGGTPRLGRTMGGFDHSTLIYARDKIAKLIQTDPWFTAHVEAVRRALGLEDRP